MPALFGKLLVAGAAAGHAAWAAEPATCGAGEVCGDAGRAAARAVPRDSALLQTSRRVAAASGNEGIFDWWRRLFPKKKHGPITSDCKHRLKHYEEHHSACVVVRDGKALLVWVPYGGAPGWDLPGGMKDDGEAACETAEREVCEETGFQVRATKRLTYNVFECEIVAANVCKNPVAEGFLEKKWARSSELGQLQYRGWTWGDKVGLLRSSLGGPALLQAGEAEDMGRALSPAVRSAWWGWPRGSPTSDCSARLRVTEEAHSACVVTRNNRALLVWVPYGSAPGWDLPGGRKHDGESACETAEREVCEETGFKVRAVERLAYNIFKCEIVSAHFCKNPVDEGFLKKTWAVKEDLGSLQYRGGTWGDKQGFLQGALRSTAPQPAWTDACGCKMCHGEGFSSSAQQCAVGKDTQPSEACTCLQHDAKEGEELVDECGCKSCDGQGWSTTAGACASTSTTSPEEACTCRQARPRARPWLRARAARRARPQPRRRKAEEAHPDEQMAKQSISYRGKLKTLTSAGRREGRVER